MRSVRSKYYRLLAMSCSLAAFLFIALTDARSQSPLPTDNFNLFASAKLVDPPLRLNEINARAIRHFKNHFLQTNEETWIRSNDFYVASFVDKGIMTKAYYHSHGGFAYYVKYYSATSLNPQIRSMIMKKFPGYSIDVITEVGNLDAEIFYVKIKSNSIIKMLQVLNENIEVIEDYLNGGI